MKPYYYVLYPLASRPEKFRSESITDAVAHSEMLASKYPGQSFEILKCVGISQISTAKTFWVDGFSLKNEEVAE